jgi:hypothetical protein
MRLNHVRSRDGHAVADVQEGVVVGAAEILFQHEFLARHHQERPLVALVEHILVVHQHLKARPAQIQKLGILAAVGRHPADIGIATIERRRDLPAMGHGDIGQGEPRDARARRHAGGAKQ